VGLALSKLPPDAPVREVVDSLDGVQRVRGKIYCGDSMMSIFEDEDFYEITEAGEGKHGPDQERIAREGLRWLKLILQKNRDYGSSAWQSPVLCPSMPCSSAILVRMSDKIRRLGTLTTNNAHASVANESLEDTMRDLGAYALLYLARPK
jgi:hypothetical protein